MSVVVAMVMMGRGERTREVMCSLKTLILARSFVVGDVWWVMCGG